MHVAVCIRIHRTVVMILYNYSLLRVSYIHVILLFIEIEQRIS